jgi:Zn-dependent protease/CBS domain-containing protein
LSWNIRIARVRGIPITLHWTFLLFLLAYGVLGYADGGTGAALLSVVVFCLVFGFVVLHELAHSVVAQGFGLKVRGILLLPIGGIASLERMPEEPRKEAAIAVAGPAFNIVVAVALFAFMGMHPGITFDYLKVEANPSIFAKGIVILFQVNFMLGVFNLVPAFPMDGGRLLRAALGAFGVPFVRATRTAVTVGWAFFILFGIVSLYTRNPMLTFIALILAMGGSTEYAAVRARSGLLHLSATHLLPQDPLGVEPTTPLGALLPYLVGGGQRDFPVIKGGRVAGMVCSADLARHLASPGGPDLPAGRVMRPPVLVSATDTLADIQHRLESDGCQVACIIRNGRLAGMVSLEGLARLSAILESGARG